MHTLTFSGMDAMNEVSDHVARVVQLNQPAVAFTEHGNMASTVQGYKAAMKAGLAYYPGEEFYLVRDVNDPDTKANRYHLGILALDEKGYEAMVKLTTLSWSSDRFYYKPLIDLSDLAFLHEQGYTDHLAVTTGCYSGMVTQALLGQVQGATATNMITMLQAWFPNTTYVELHNHGITWKDHGVDDVWIMQQLHQIAQERGLPVLFGGDSHYVMPEQAKTHDLMKDICYFGAGEDIHFDGGPYHLLGSDEVATKVSKQIMADIEQGHGDLLDRNRVRITPLDNYKFQVPAMFKNADDVLREKSEEGLLERFGETDPGAIPAIYWERLDHELDVIAKMGMANYHLLVKTHVTDWCRDNHIVFNVRGSANGSLVCYAVGITTVDPIVWKVLFERYLSIERMKPPDIDIDVDYEGRPRVANHLRSVFPTMTQVGTWGRIGFSKNKDGSDDLDAGSVIVQYMAAMRKKNPQFQGRVLPEHRDALNDLAETPVYKSMGTNAAGFIIPGDGYPIDRYLPQARIISSDTLVTQFNKDDVEAMGYLKIDLLGLKALQTLNNTLVKIGRQPNEWDWIADDDKAACELVRKNQTAGVFQYEGWTQGKGGKEMGVKSTQDMIFGLALYRPALMNGGQKDLYLENRKFKTKAKQARLHPAFDKVLDDTAGVPLYQEQIMQMLQVLGMAFAEYNELMTAIKASNGFIAGAAKTFARLMPLFYDLCEEKGLTDLDADEAWSSVIGFTEYGFNRAHSTSYGLMAYRAAYLKAHHPLEFMTSLLSVWSSDKDKTREYIHEARRLGFSVVKPDVNVSEIGWREDPMRKNSLRKGLEAMPGIGKATAALIVAERDANGLYTSIQDFIDRLPARPVTGGSKWKSKGELVGVCRILYEGNAFRSTTS